MLAAGCGQPRATCLAAAWPSGQEQDTATTKVFPSSTLWAESALHLRRETQPSPGAPRAQRAECTKPSLRASRAKPSSPWSLPPHFPSWFPVPQCPPPRTPVKNVFHSPKDKPQKLNLFSHGRECPLPERAELPPALQKRLSSLKRKISLILAFLQLCLCC